MILAGDIGATKTLLGRFGGNGVRPAPEVVREYVTLDFDGVEALVHAFASETGMGAVDAVCLGIAGIVNGLTARMVNVPWGADASGLSRAFGGCPVAVLNDLEAMAYAVPVLTPAELLVLQAATGPSTGNVALIAAGTGLGEALLHRVGDEWIASPTEAGHADFAARTPRELEFVAEMTRVRGRVDNERVLSGPGLVNLFRFTHGTQDERAACVEIGDDIDVHRLPAAISAAALNLRCDQCAEALAMFVEAFGAEAGNLALRAGATAGVYIGGGIAPKILPALESGAFLGAFRAKGPMTDVMETIPVAVILNPAGGLLGAAVRGQRLARGR
jgi:glucokinase